MKMIKKIKNSATYRLFRMDRIPNGYVATIDRVQHDSRDQKMATATWTGIAALLMVLAIRHLLPGVVYAMASAGLHVTIGTEAHDLMSGCIFDICRCLKDLMIEFTWVGGFLDTIHEYKLIQLLITVGCGFGFYKIARMFAFACVQCKKHFSKPINVPTQFEAATTNRRQRRRTRRDRRVG